MKNKILMVTILLMGSGQYFLQAGIQDVKIQDDRQEKLVSLQDVIKNQNYTTSQKIEQMQKIVDLQHNMINSKMLMVELL